jgi:hypothetical protein
VKKFDDFDDLEKEDIDDFFANTKEVDYVFQNYNDIISCLELIKVRESDK